MFPRAADYAAVEGIIRLARLTIAAAAVTASAGVLAGCTRPEIPEVYAVECERRTVRMASTAAPTSLADALAHQASINKAYRDCLDRRGVRAAP